MIIKKLAVPLINDKILAQTEFCLIATAGISEAGFDFINTRIPNKTKIEIVTGLDALTSPKVLKRIWRNYSDRMSLRIYTKNPFLANVFIFDLPYRKSVAFSGSGSLTLEGLKDHEHLFIKITDAKEIESLKSWFVGYFEFGEPLTEKLIQEYEAIYYDLKQREIYSLHEKQEVTSVSSRSFNIDAIKFRNQYFAKEDYVFFATLNRQQQKQTIAAEQERIDAKLHQLASQLERDLSRLKLSRNDSPSSMHPVWQVVPSRSMIFVIDAPVEGSHHRLNQGNFLFYALTQQAFTIGWVTGNMKERDTLNQKMTDAIFRKNLFNHLRSLSGGYSLIVSGQQKSTQGILSEDALWELTRTDDPGYFPLIIIKSFSPGDQALSNDNISTTLVEQFNALVSIDKFIKDYVLPEVSPTASESSLGRKPSRR